MARILACPEVTLHGIIVTQEGHGMKHYTFLNRAWYQPDWHSHASQRQGHKQREEAMPAAYLCRQVISQKCPAASCQGAVDGAASQTAGLQLCVPRCGLTGGAAAPQ